MRRMTGKSGSALARVPAGLIFTAFALGMIVSSDASAATKEIVLASPAQGLAYCNSGKMPGADIAYIAGSGGLAQFGPTAKCVQQIPTKTAVKKAVQVIGSRVSECSLQGAAKSVQFCQGGGMGTYDIGYINGKVGRTVSGPGYGCVVNFSTTGIGNAICR